MNTLSKNLVLGGVAAAFISGGAVTAWAQSSNPSEQQTSIASADAGRGFGPNRDGEPGHDLSAALAQKLGLTEEQVSQAFAALHEEQQANRPDGAPARGANRDANRDAMDKALAEKLGVDQTTLAKAMDELRTEKDAEHDQAHRDELSSCLDSAVDSGQLSSSARDSVLKAYDAGVLAPPRGAK